MMFTGLGAFALTPMDERGIDEAAFIAAQAADTERTTAASDRLQGFWELFETYGSLRVVAATAAELGLTQRVDAEVLGKLEP